MTKHAGAVDIIVQHDSIGLALAALDLGDRIHITETDNLAASANSVTKSVQLAWAPLDVLLLQPEYAWLSRNPDRFIRLPVSLAELRRKIEAARQGTETVPARMFLPLGQLYWAVDQVLEGAQNADWETAAARAGELRRFCSRHWHGWFDDLSEQLERALLSRGEASCVQCLERLRDSAGPIVVYAGFSEFFHGAGRDIVNSGAGQIHALLKYSRTAPEDQRARGLEIVISNLRQENWWSPLQAALASVQAEMNCVAMCGFDPESVLQGRLTTAVAHLAAFSEIADGLSTAPDTWGARVGDAEGHIAKVIDAVKGIEGDASACRRALQGEGDAPPAAD